MQDHVVEVTNLSKDYDDFALRDISLSVRRGSITGLFGPNGAGKSTLIKVIAQQAPVGGGTVRVLGLDPARSEAAIRNRVGYVPQEPAFYSGHPVRWNARFAAAYYERWDPGGFSDLLERFKVNPLKQVKRLSGGQKKLLSMAFALSHEAELLILDEPTAGLDDLAEEVLFLDAGRVVLSEDRQDLLARWKWIHFRDGALDRDTVSSLKSVTSHPFGSCGLTDDFQALRERLADALASGDAKVENASLEDVLVSHIEEA